MKKRSNLTNQNSFLRWKKSNLWNNFILEIFANFFVSIFMVILIIVVRFLLEPFDLSLCWYNWWKHGSIIVLFIFVLFVGLSIFVFNSRLPALFVVAAEDKFICLICFCFFNLFLSLIIDYQLCLLWLPKISGRLRSPVIAINVGVLPSDK